MIIKLKKSMNWNKLKNSKYYCFLKIKSVEYKILDHLTKLEVLDLHSNRIANLEGLSKLKSLKIIKVENNLFTKLEALEELNTLIELNIKMN